MKLLVIGIDGGSWELFKPWAEAGHLPNINRFLKQGYVCPLASIIPPVTVPAVPCIATGVNPGKHGVYSFLKRKKNSYEEELVSAANIKSKPFWEILDGYGVSCGIFMLPFSYPSKKLNHGFVVSGFGVSKIEEGVNPPELVSELRGKVPCFKRFEELAIHELSAEFLTRDAKELVRCSSEVMAYLVKEKNPDVFLAWFDECEKTQHMLWKYMDPRFPQYHSIGAKKYRGVVLEVARETDKAIGKLLDKVGPDTHVLLISDHGFGTVLRYSPYYNMTNWLQEKGFLVAKKTFGQRLRSVLPYESLYSGVSKLKLNALVKRLLPKQIVNVLHENASPSLNNVDWNKTRVYSQGNECFMFVNLKGREPKGVVEPENYEKVRLEVLSELTKLKEPKTGLPTLNKVYKREEVFQGPFLEDAPDIVFYPTELPTLVKGDELTAEPEGERPDPEWVTTWHHRDGILGVLGPSVKPGWNNKKQSLLGITPTILFLAGAPFEGLDAKPFDAFANDFTPKAIEIREENLLDAAMDDSLKGL